MKNEPKEALNNDSLLNAVIKYGGLIAAVEIGKLTGHVLVLTEKVFTVIEGLKWLDSGFPLIKTFFEKMP